MRMRSLPPGRASLVGAALSLWVGCASTSPALPPPPSPPPSSVPAAPASPWQRARVGDGVTYAFSVQHTAPRGSAPRSLRGRVVLDVVAVQQPRIWVRVAFQDEAGQPLVQARLGPELLLPIGTGTTRPLDVSPPGEPSLETLSLAGREWRARHFERDARASDGARILRVYATEPGPLYLLHGLLRASTEAESRAVSRGLELTLSTWREGAATPAVTPTWERPLGPGTYYDRRVERGPLLTLQRVCLASERGFLLRTEGPIDPHVAPCADLSGATSLPLEEEVLQWLQAGLTEGDASTAREAGTPGSFQVRGQELPSLTVRHSEEDTGLQRITTETFAAEPWEASLAGLALEARLAPLAESTERVEPQGQHTVEDATRLVRWGTWLDGPR